MRHRSNWKLLFLAGAVLLAALLGAVFVPHSAVSDEDHLRNLRRSNKAYFLLNDLEQGLPSEISRVFGLTALLRLCERNSDAARAALLASGYFVKVQATVTNLE